MGTFRERPAPADLAAVVESVWTNAPGRRKSIRVLPDGCVDLIAEFRRSATGLDLVALRVCGPNDAPVDMTLPDDSAWAGLRSRLGAAGPVLGVRPAELFGRQIAAADVGDDLARLVDAIIVCNDLDAVTLAMTRHVAGLACRSATDGVTRRVRRAVDLLGRGATVVDTAASLGVTERTLHRDVVAATGMAPKAVSRLMRFRRAMALLRAGGRADLCEVALEAGYADQSHLTREVRRYAGATPAEVRSGVGIG